MKSLIRPPCLFIGKGLTNHTKVSFVSGDSIGPLVQEVSGGRFGRVLAAGGAGGRRALHWAWHFFLYLNHPTKIDVTSGLIGTQQPVSAKSNDGVWVRHDFFGFLSNRYQEL